MLNECLLQNSLFTRHCRFYPTIIPIALSCINHGPTSVSTNIICVQIFKMAAEKIDMALDDLIKKTRDDKKACTKLANRQHQLPNCCLRQCQFEPGISIQFAICARHHLLH